jgi:hypothetical protein
MRRTTISLGDDQERALSKFAQPGPYQDELRGWARERGIELNDSPAEAALVRVLIDAGIEHIRAYSADVAYRELAEAYLDEGITGEVTALGGDAGEVIDAGGAVGAGGAVEAGGAAGVAADVDGAGGSGIDRGPAGGGSAAGRSRGSRHVAGGPR